MRIESAIQKALVYWINHEYPGVKVAASQNENSFKATQLGMDIGEPDLRLLLRLNNVTHLFYLELKKLKGKLLPSQIAWNEDFDNNFKSVNCTRSVAYGYLEAQERVSQWWHDCHNI